MGGPVRWPEGKAFAFSIFDDPDGQTEADGRELYRFLSDLGFRTTKGIWPLACDLPPHWGGSLEDPSYLNWCLELQRAGFEIGYHNARQLSSNRAETARALDAFRAALGHDPRSMSNHYGCAEGMYWGDARLGGWRRLAYDVVTAGRNWRRFRGHVASSPLFWGDYCRDRIAYVRNFVFDDIDTLAVCPHMPYVDPRRPFVQAWYASSEGANVRAFTALHAEQNQDRLVAQGGACIMYVHFGHGFVERGRLNSTFRRQMERLSRFNGWFVPVSTLLDHLAANRGVHAISPAEAAVLERRWLLQKLRRRTS